MFGSPLGFFDDMMKNTVGRKMNFNDEVKINDKR
jgi:hypothetical protein